MGVRSPRAKAIPVMPRSPARATPGTAMARRRTTHGLRAVRARAIAGAGSRARTRVRSWSTRWSGGGSATTSVRRSDSSSWRSVIVLRHQQSKAGQRPGLSGAHRLGLLAENDADLFRGQPGEHPQLEEFLIAGGELREGVADVPVLDVQLQRLAGSWLTRQLRLDRVAGPAPAPARE